MQRTLEIPQEAADFLRNFRLRAGDWNREGGSKRPFTQFSEDCLNLNIWTPSESVDHPVLVYIHGGSYETGGGTNPSFDGKGYCARGVICVTINYRLNAFACACGDGLTGNFGLQDQICALRWIRRNIAAFGGDPERVTVMGESAGAMSVQNLIYTPHARGLFGSAIMLSGAGILQKSFEIRTPETALEVWQKVKESFGVRSLEELKSADPGELYRTWKDICNSEPRFAFPATPVIDGEIIPDDPGTLVRNGDINAVPAICDVLSEDMWPYRLYHTILDWAQMMEAAGLSNVYGLYMDRKVPGSDHGAYHGADVRYAFGSMDSSWRPYEEIDRRISFDMMDYFAGFVKMGFPLLKDLRNGCLSAVETGSSCTSVMPHVPCVLCRKSG